uniref:Uncharacterized protein n=1 Tax=Sipha flava TaxID=143950 RepID=A0A2S2R4L3_9HEMI
MSSLLFWNFVCDRCVKISRIKEEIITTGTKSCVQQQCADVITVHRMQKMQANAAAGCLEKMFVHAICNVDMERITLKTPRAVSHSGIRTCKTIVNHTHIYTGRVRRINRRQWNT